MSDYIAVIGLAGRFPGAKTINQFWHNLCNGIESIHFFSDQELITEGVKPEMLVNPFYVKAGGLLDDIDLFDADFFKYSPRRASTTDPQQRLFLECAWEALENAGYNAEAYSGAIGVYAGMNKNQYMPNNLEASGTLSGAVDMHQITRDNSRDFLSTQISYKLNLRGPSLTVQTACSTSLVVVHLASQALLNGECDMALAGGVGIWLVRSGYIYQEGGILSPDGHCRTFDAEAKGTIWGNGAGLVALKRLDDAIDDGDYIYAVIKGTAINNDGASKIGFNAPSIQGQTEVISEAIAIADVDPETITYVEAHGTATPLGDPIEMAALQKAFKTDKKQYCAIGSVKSNIGHLDTASGIAGLIKTVLALHHKQIPPSLHFKKPNPKIDFKNSPFYVNTTLSEWSEGTFPRRAGVSSFGIGGTNAHAVLEEAPLIDDNISLKKHHLLLLSAKTETALEQTTVNLINHLKEHQTINLADVAYTLQVGRQSFNYRRAIVCDTIQTTISILEKPDNKNVITNQIQTENSDVIFMFSGQGSQYVNMGYNLYKTESVFKTTVDQCLELIAPHLEFNLKKILYPHTTKQEKATEQLQQTAIAQPALFIIEYALAQLWLHWDIKPKAMVGHSIGEYVAACLAGVLSLSDALALVAKRGKLMQSLPKGAMLAVSLAEEELQPFLDDDTSIAVINTPKRCVASGPTTAIKNLQEKLSEKHISCRLLHTSHAFHSKMMDPILDTFTNHLKTISFSPPQIPYLSNLSGTWITDLQAISPTYWTEHLRHPVRFADNIKTILSTSNSIMLEIGPGQTLSTLTKQHPARTKAHLILNSLPTPKNKQNDDLYLLNNLAQLWTLGIPINLEAVYQEEERRRLPLPTYPFERKRYWIEPNQPKVETVENITSSAPKRNKSNNNNQEEQIASSLTKPPVDIALLNQHITNILDAEQSISQTTELERIINQQLDIIAQQLALLESET